MMVKRILMALIFLVFIGSIAFSEYKKRNPDPPAQEAAQSVSGDPSLPPQQAPAAAGTN